MFLDLTVMTVWDVLALVTEIIYLQYLLDVMGQDKPSCKARDVL